MTTLTVNNVEPAVLEDPTGRRARWMRRAGRVVFVVFLGWLLAIVLGGLGLVPVDRIPFTRALRPSSGPAPLAKPSKPRRPSASDLRPAAPAERLVGSSTASRPARSNPVQPRRQSATARGRAKTTTVTAARGRSATAPGQTKTTTTRSPGRSTTAPGHNRTTATTTTVSPGRSSSAPGKPKH